jgi:hypothetical protein
MEVVNLSDQSITYLDRLYVSEGVLEFPDPNRAFNFGNRSGYGILCDYFCRAGTTRRLFFVPTQSVEPLKSRFRHMFDYFEFRTPDLELVVL